MNEPKDSFMAQISDLTDLRLLMKIRRMPSMEISDIGMLN